MSYISVRGEQSTSVEIAALTALAALAASGSGQFIRKTGATSFENATVAESLSIAFDDLTDASVSSFSQGDIIYYDGSSLVNLGPGTSGQVLKTQGPNANPVWGDVSSTQGANTALSNLSSVQINASLLFDTDGTYDIGSSSVGINDLHLGSGGVINFDGGDVTLTHSANTLTFDGGTLALGSNSLTMTGSLAATGARVTKGWFTDIESTNMPTVGGTAIDSTFAPIASPTFTGTVTLPTGLTGVLRADSGVVSTDTDVTDLVTSATDSAEGKVELATIAETNTGTDTGRAVTPDGLSSAVRSIMLTAAGGAPLTTAGCSEPTKVEAATNDINYYVLDFDASTEEHAFWSFAMPENWNAGTVNATFYWTNAGGMATETVVWGIAGGSWGDDDAIDAALGTEITTTDTFLAQGDLHISSESSAITIANATAGEWVNIVVARKVGSDDLTGDARLIAVKLTYTIDQYSDEI